MRICFGPFAFDRQSRLLWKGGTEIALPPRVIGVLELLIDRAGQVVARQDLLDGVWKDAFVTDTSLAEAVSFLRQALGDDPQAPRYIQTVHRRGYRFVAPVTADSGSDPGSGAGAPNWGLAPDRHFAGASGARARSATSGEARTERLWQFLPLWAAGLCVVLAVAVTWRLGGNTPEPPLVARFEIAAAPGTTFDRRGPAVAVSADGRTIAWSACERATGVCGLYTRTLERLESARVAGSDGAIAPFFSPDGRWIGFFADGKLKKIAASGGSASVLADAAAPGGGAWGPDGRIAFAGAPAGGLSLVSDEGGAVTALTPPRIDRGEVRHVYPTWLPSGGLIFTILSTTLPDAPGDLAAMAPRGHEWKTLRGGVTRAALAAPAYLLLSNGPDLQAVTFDERSLTLTGGADSVVAAIGAPDGGRGVAHFAIGGGTLAVVEAAGPAHTTWADGADASALGPLSSVAISPDSRRAAGVIAEGAGSDIWIADLASNALTRMTYGGTNVSPAWSADGTRLFFATRSSGAFGIASREIESGAIATVAASGDAHLFPGSVAADGRIAVTTTVAGGRTAVGTIAGPGAPLQLLTSGPFDEGSPAFSPDGAWLALESSESGRPEIVARDLRGGGRIAISTDGGSHPRWSADGRWIYYDSRQRLMRAGFDGAQRSARAPEVVHDGASGRALAVTPSGRVLVSTDGSSGDRALVVLQWLHELRQRLPLPLTTPR